MTDSANRDLKPIRKWLGRRSVLFHWMRRRAESAGFLFLLILLVPLGAARMIGGAANPPDLRALWVRWRRFLLHGLHDLRCAYWPGIRYERLTSAETVASKLRLPDLGPMPSPVAP